MNSFKRRVGKQNLPLIAISDYDINQYPFSFLDDLNRLQFDYRLWLAAQRTVTAKYANARFARTDLKVTVSLDNVQLDPALSQLAINNQVVDYIKSNQDNEQPPRPEAINGYFHAILPLLTFVEDNNHSNGVSGQFKLFFLLVAIKEIKQSCCNGQESVVQVSYTNHQLHIGGLTLKKLLLPSEQQQHNDVLSLLSKYLSQQQQAISLNQMLNEKFICGENLRVVTYPYGFSTNEVDLIQPEKNQMVLMVGGSLEKPTQATLIFTKNGQRNVVSRDPDHMGDIFKKIIKQRPSNHLQLHRRSSVGEDISIAAYQNSELLQDISTTFNHADYSVGLIAELMQIRNKDKLTLAEYKRMVGEIYSCLLCLSAAYDLHDAGNRKVRVRRCADLSQQYIQTALQQSTPLPYNFSVDQIIKPNNINFNTIKNQSLLQSNAEVDYNLYMPKRNLWEKFCHWTSKHKLLLTYLVASIVVIALTLLFILQPFTLPLFLLTAIKTFITYEATWKLAATGTALVWGAFSTCWLAVWTVAKLISNYCCCCRDDAKEDNTNAQIIHNNDSLSISNSLRDHNLEHYDDHSKLLDHKTDKQRNLHASNDDYNIIHEFNESKMERDKESSHSSLSLNENNHNPVSVVSMMLVPSLQHQRNRDNDSLQQSHPWQNNESHDNERTILATEQYKQYNNNKTDLIIETDDDISDQDSQKHTIE